MTAVLLAYTVARVTGLSHDEGQEIAAVCSDRTIAERAVAEVWAQDRLARIVVTEWLIDVFGPDARRTVFCGDRTDYTDPEDGPQWRTSR